MTGELGERLVVSGYFARNFSSQRLRALHGG